MHPSQQHIPVPKPKQRRYRATPEQLRHLIALFEDNPSPSTVDLQDLAGKINMPPQSAVLWFKNRRARVPYKKSDKVLVVKRRQGLIGPHSEALQPQGTTSQMGAVAASDHLVSGTPSDPGRIASLEPEVTEEVAVADSMAEMAMAALKNSTASDSGEEQKGAPFDGNFMASHRPGGSKTGVEFVPACSNGNTNFTQKRPRIVPPAPRLSLQREYAVGDRVEILETSKGICCAWYAAIVIARVSPTELSLGESAGVLAAGNEGISQLIKNKKIVGNGMNNEKDDRDVQGADGVDSPRTVRSPVTSSDAINASATDKIRYLVRYEHRFVEDDSEKQLEGEIEGSKMRPAAPFAIYGEDWRPEAGEAVEVLQEGAWFVAVTKGYVVRKGYMVGFESGEVQWIRRDRLRPYQIWRGGDIWVTKTKAPLAIVRKSVGLSVTHPPGGKRKRGSQDGGSLSAVTSSGSKDYWECSGRRSKRSRSNCMDGTGPDGLPEGWRVDYLKRSGFMQGGNRRGTFYIAPDGNRLKCLKEARRYVKMMGPG